MSNLSEIRNRVVLHQFNPISAIVIENPGVVQTLTFEDPKTVMQKFKEWVLTNSKGRPIFILQG